MCKLEKILSSFKEITKSSIIELEQGNLENAELYMKKREEIIQELKLVQYTQDEFESIVDKIQLIQLDKELENLLKENIAIVKDEMRDFNVSKEAYNNYNKFAGRTPNFINQKI